MATMACARCGRLGQITVQDEEGQEFPDLTASVPEGILIYVCDECMTDQEAVQRARRSCVAMLDAAEELVSSMEMIFERIPTMKDDPEAKRAHAEAKAKADEARAMLAALQGIDDDG
jgi:hypothetical protein